MPTIPSLHHGFLALSLGISLSVAHASPQSPPPAPSGSESKVSAPTVGPAADILVLLNIRQAKSEGFTVSKNIDGGLNFKYQPRGGFYLYVSSEAMINEISQNDNAEKRRQFFNQLDPDLLERLWQEAVAKISAQGIDAKILKWGPSKSAVGRRGNELVATGEVFALHPRVDMPLLKPLIDKGELAVIAEISTQAVLNQVVERKQKQAESAQKREARNQDLIARMPTLSDRMISLYIIPTDAEREAKDSRSSRGTQVCGIDVPGEYKEWLSGMRYHEGFSKALGEPRQRWLELNTKDLNGIYEAIQTRKCQVPIVNNEEAVKLIAALQRDQIKFNVFWTLPKADLVASYAEAEGYKSMDKFRFAKALDMKVSGSQVEELEPLGVTSVETFQAAATRMSKAKYATGQDPYTVLAYLKDEAEGAPKKWTAVQVRDERNRKEAAAKAAQEQAQKAQAAAYAKEYPYIALLSCGMPNHMNILACFASGGHGSGTDMTVRNGDDQTMYKIYNIGSAGKETREGLTIDLKRQFYITAQNNHGSLILTLKIIDRASGKVLFTDQASKWGVVTARN
jgi:hypothetical protein